ncbi:MAG: acetolactate decarboxylase [Synergistaceae bacterium]|nr:acetolactate decarboxylase [Synergistaceae bacterium]
MRKLLALLLVVLSAGTCWADVKPDYSIKDNWCNLPDKVIKDVDTFFIYPTNYMGFNDGDADYAEIDNAEMRRGAQGDYIEQAGAFAESTNIFMPYYRQAGMPRMKRAWKETGDCEDAVSGMPYEDIKSALDYYFEHYNNGRPFIIAGHSQGSVIAKLVLKRYFKDHKDYYNRMVAAYVIGYAVTKDELAANPHLKFATGESDTGVIISWNTEGPKNVELNANTAVLLPNSISINPLNWKLDETYASSSENLGSLIADAETGKVKFGDIGADAQVVLKRGVIVTNAKAEPLPEDSAKIAAEFFGSDGRHASDYSFYFNNIKANAAKRIAAYKAKLKSESESDGLFQVALLQSLMQGEYDGVITVKELKAFGDTGIGTFQGVNGELVALNGVIYRALWDGRVEPAPDDETVPFANITFFDADITREQVKASSMAELKDVLNAIIKDHGVNQFYMAKVTGVMSDILVRSELKQEKPYKPLNAALETDQREFRYKDIAGTIVALYCPAYMNGLNTAGWHLHFVSDDGKKGGHVLDLVLNDGVAELDVISEFAMIVPNRESFNNKSLEMDLKREIEQVEGK